MRLKGTRLQAQLKGILNMLAYIFSYLFTPSGRFRRVDFHLVFWTFFFINMAVSLFYLAWGLKSGALVMADDFKLAPADIAAVDGEKLYNTLSAVFGILGYIMGIMVTIKRFHDLGHSGWNTMLIYFPLPVIMLVALALFMGYPYAAMGIGGVWLLYVIWLMIKLSFFMGEPLDNKYGPSPYTEGPPYVSQALMIVFVAFLVSVFAGYTAFNVGWPMAKARDEAKKAALVPPPTAAELAKIADDKRKKDNADTVARAHKGDPEAQYAVASNYFTGSNDVVQDYAQAAQWLQKAAEQDHAIAQYNLGMLYFDGKGFAVDYGRAYFWLTRSSLRGHNPGGTDYRAQAGAQLTPEMRAQIEKAAHDWKPAPKAPPAAPVTAAPPQPATPAPATP